MRPARTIVCPLRADRRLRLSLVNVVLGKRPPIDASRRQFDPLGRAQLGLDGIDLHHDQPIRRDLRRHTDPETCLDVFDILLGIVIVQRCPGQARDRRSDVDEGRLLVECGHCRTAEDLGTPFLFAGPKEGRYRVTAGRKHQATVAQVRTEPSQPKGRQSLPQQVRGIAIGCVARAARC